MENRVVEVLNKGSTAMQHIAQIEFLLTMGTNPEDIKKGIRLYIDQLFTCGQYNVVDVINREAELFNHLNRDVAFVNAKEVEFFDHLKKKEPSTDDIFKEFKKLKESREK